jgi:hypothetical protein
MEQLAVRSWHGGSTKEGQYEVSKAQTLNFDPPSAYRQACSCTHKELIVFRYPGTRLHELAFAFALALVLVLVLVLKESILLLIFVFVFDFLNPFLALALALDLIWLYLRIRTHKGNYRELFVSSGH